MIKVFYCKYLVLSITLISLNYYSIAYSQDLETSIDSVIHDKFLSNSPGATFLISNKGEIIYNKAFGLANLELNVAMQIDNVFEIGSMTKQFTAIAILMLYEKGKVSLDDEITQYIPDYPTNGHQITIHHLLTHTSGIKNFTELKKLKAISKQDLSPAELVDLFKNEPMDFAPGEKFKYNNSGYVLLGYIIEKVSGQTYADFVEKNIFHKLEMSNSLYTSHAKVVKNRASGYHKKDVFINKRVVSSTLPYASGSLMSSTADLFKWHKAIKTYALISRETTKKAFTNYTLNDSQKINYGYGWHIKSIDDNLSYEHGGSIFGFKSMGVFLPDLDIYVIGLSNCDCNSPTQLTRDIADLVADYE